MGDERAERATPSTPPTWRAALMVPEASPARSGGAASITAVVAAGMVNDMPSPAAMKGAMSTP